MKSGYRFSLTLGAMIALLAYKSVAIARLAPLPVALGWLLECTLLLGFWALSELGQKRPRWMRGSLTALFYLLLHALVITSFAHTFFFSSAAERRFSPLDLELATVGYFFSDVLPLTGWAGLGGLLLALHGLAVALRHVVRQARPLCALALALGGALLFGFASAGLARVPSPLVDMGADVWAELTTERLVAATVPSKRYGPDVLDKSAGALPSSALLRFKKVLVFVMETMTSAAFERERALLPATTFVNAAQAKAHVHTRYFATNQDSRTGMLAMLGSRFIPYEAYTEEGRDQYLFLGGKRSLVDIFSELGYRTAFAVSQAEIELVVGDLPWNERLHLGEGEQAELDDRYLCFVPYEFEHSCEDRALLPRVLSFIDRNERVFLYQEFVWGHASEYNEASGKSNAEYYSAYLDAVVAHLTQTGALDDTLLVLTADHGFRDKGLQTDRAVYQLPLWFYATRHAATRDDRLFSHLDFKDLLLHELSPQATAPSESPFVMIIGPTGTSFLTVLTKTDQFMVMKAQKGERYLLHTEGTVGETNHLPGEFLRIFDDYMAYFARFRG